MNLNVALLLAAAAMSVPVLIGLFERHRRRQREPRIQEILREVVMRYGKPQLVISTERLELLIGTEYVHTLDLEKQELVETFIMKRIEALEITDKSSNLVVFRFKLWGGAHSPFFTTDAITGFADLFNLVIANGKEIRYTKDAA